MQRLALTGWAAVAEPERLRLRNFAVAARLIRTARRRILKIPETWPWAHAVTSAHHRLTALTTSPCPNEQPRSTRRTS
ncbi:transposase [Amycolatopsis taiwanensis]|uniref:Transposase DDE domain-containing protein n=1 Tax=Amycolatopsis taiwanensis TaxID=342230 RepID=A0A9W6VKW0_9PSEU|nr:transposase [Amycolatopsis taiwanensis]GLY70837.1 hypothetical protein Atai01_74560 [Amycolatopsis taiwanensis]